MAPTYSTFGPYILFKEVLADELGHIYRAGELVKGTLGRTAWLRVFDRAAVPQAELGNRLDDANRVGETLQAANVGAHSRFSVHDGTTCNAWDYAPGQPLTAVLRKVQEEGFPVPVDNALLIMEKLSLALSAGLAVDMGGAPLVHGFLHPGTIIITNDGEGLVSGFVVGTGLLGLLDDGAANPACAPYLAPEILTTRTPSSRGDVYSLGAILFHLLTGKPLPADPQQRREVVTGAHLAFDEEPVPKDIMAVLSRALADRPEERFSSAADFKKELDKLLYGGAYSPTTFNLALFMDRLFRTEIEAEERERLTEADLDVTPYVRPEPLVEEQEQAPESRPGRGGGKGPWIGIAAAVVVVAAVGAWFIFGRGPATPPPPPTPTPEQVLAQRRAQQAQVQALVQQQVTQLMAEREGQIRKELLGRQDEINRLQKRLKEVEKSGGATANTRRQREQIQRQIAAAEKAKQNQEQALQQERQKAIEEAKRRVQATAVPATATATAVVVAPTAAPTSPPAPTATPIPPTPTPAVREGEIVAGGPGVREPVLIKRVTPSYPPVAQRMQFEGEVTLRALVGIDGSVENVQILEATHPGIGFEKAAEDSVRQWRYRPATKSGVKVRVWVRIRIPFRLR
ncbi:MAG: TonB family protein [Acidobacteria bacterium]|nr:TonB family protein [Acidobacteriota bacterium]